MKKIIPIFSVLFLLILGFLKMGPTGHDDAHITFWASHVLIEQGQILNYNGDKIEQSSTLAFVLLIAFISKITSLNIVFVGHVLSILFACLTVLLSLHFVKRLELRTHISIPLLIGTCPYFVYWSFSGMESSFFTFFSLLIIVLTVDMIRYKKHYLQYGLFAFITLVFLLIRPEAFFLNIGTLLLVLFFLKRQSADSLTLKRLYAILGLNVVLMSVIFLFRYSYFGKLFPNPVYAKSGQFSVEKLLSGLQYVLEFEMSEIELSYMFILSLLVYSLYLLFVNAKNKSKEPIGQLYIKSFILIYLCFIIASGGDWMSYMRFYAHIAPLVLIVIIDTVFQEIKNKKIITFILISLLLFQINESLIVSERFGGKPFSNISSLDEKLNEKGIHSKNYSWFEKMKPVNLRDITFIYQISKVINDLLQEKDQVTIMSVQAGMIPYHLKMTYGDKIKFIDMYSLTTDRFSSCIKDKRIRRNYFGHVVTYPYYFEHEKTILSSCNMEKPDVIYDLYKNKVRFNAIRQSDYKILFEQFGVIHQHPLVVGNLTTDEIFAVHKDVLKYLKSDDAKNYEWDIFESNFRE